MYAHKIDSICVIYSFAVVHSYCWYSYDDPEHVSVYRNLQIISKIGQFECFRCCSGVYAYKTVSICVMLSFAVVHLRCWYSYDYPAHVSLDPAHVSLDPAHVSLDTTP